MKRRQGQIAKLMRLIGDKYFERYGSDTSDDVREKEEKATEEKLQKLDPEELPVSTDEDNENPATENDEEGDNMIQSDEIVPEETESVEPQTSDTIPQ
jgi:hypothetical protein